MYQLANYQGIIFLLKMQVKMSIEQMFEQIYYNDFNQKGVQIGKIDGNHEQLSKNGKLSKIDKRFVEVLDAGTRKNRNHYEVSLPFK